MTRHLPFLGLILLCFSVFQAGAQEQKKHTISGYIRDAKSGEVLSGATIYVSGLRTGTHTNAYGFYSLTLPADSHRVLYRYMGYKPQVKKIKLDKDITINVTLEPTNRDLGTVEVTGKKSRENVERAQMGVIDVPVTAVQELPALMGEKDLFKVLQLLPGVQSGSEGSAGFYVRGGGPDQNMVLLDEAVIYNPFHLAGFFSSFNPDALKSVSLIKGGFPAQYGGRLSSMIDVSMKDGNDKEYHGEGGVGVIASRLTLEGPLVKDRSSFMISGRRTYADLMVKPFLPEDVDAQYYFYDLNGKVNYRFSDNDRVYLSGYMGSDVVFSQEIRSHMDTTGRIRKDTTSFGMNWGNKSATLRWNHLFSKKLFSNTSIIYNDFVFVTKLQEGGFKARLESGIRDWSGKMDFDWYPTPEHRIKFGGIYTYQRFVPSLAQALAGNFELISKDQTRYVSQAAAYFNDEWTVNGRLGVNLGVRTPFFMYKDTKYFNVEPRVTAKYSLDSNTSLKAGYTYMNQFVHLVTNSTIASPLDIWIPSTDIVKPQRAQQVAAGIFHNFLNDRYEGSVEVYYKHMNNLIEYKEGAEIFLNPNIDKELAFGKGWSYGAEFLLRKREGKLTGWIGYTLAWAQRQFPDLNNGKPFFAKYDRRHDLSVTAVYHINKHWTVSAVFVYGSGHSLTLPWGTYMAFPMDGMPGQPMNGSNVYDYVERNAYKLKAFHRLDVGIGRITQHKKWTSEWRFDIYNTYSRRNPYFVYLTTETDPNSGFEKPVAKQISLFPIIPSISYSFRF